MSNHCVGVTTAESEFRSSLQVVGVRGDLRKKKNTQKKTPAEEWETSQAKVVQLPLRAGAQSYWATVLVG